MSAIPNRQTISRGPAFVRFQGALFFSKGDIELDWAFDNATVASSAFGPVFTYRKGMKPSLKLPLIGAIASLAILFPFGSMGVNTSIFGPTANTVEIIPIDTTQNKIVMAQGAIFSEPDLTLGVSGGIALGDTTFRFLPAPGVDLENANAWYTEVENDWDGTGFDPDEILVQSYDVTWMSAGTFVLTWGGDTTASLLYNAAASDVATALNALASIIAAGGVTVAGDYQNGFVVTFTTVGARTNFTGTTTGMPGGTTINQTINTAGGAATQVATLELFPWAQFSTEDAVKVKTSPKCYEAPSDRIGTYDIRFSSTSAVATLLPLNVSQSTILAAENVQGPNAGLGKNLTTIAHNLDISANGLFVRLYSATLTKGGLLWSDTKQRVPPLNYTAGRTQGTGGVNPLYYVGTEPPE